jgi:transcriptional regulator with XRE-family HTH domain
MTQRELAKRIPMSDSSISRIENGLSGPPSDEVIESIARILELDVPELLRIAGRELSEGAFQQRVLAELAAVKSSLDRLEAAVQPQPVNL